MIPPNLYIHRSALAYWQEQTFARHGKVGGSAPAFRLLGGAPPPARSSIAGAPRPELTRLRRVCSLVFNLEGHTEPEDVEPEVRPAPAAARRAAAPGAAVPAAAAQHAVLAIFSTRRVGLLTTGIVSIPVCAPLPHITVHVMQAPGVRFLLPHRMRRAFAISTIPPHAC